MICKSKTMGVITLLLLSAICSTSFARATKSSNTVMLAQGRPAPVTQCAKDYIQLCNSSSFTFEDKEYARLNQVKNCKAKGTGSKSKPKPAKAKKVLSKEEQEALAKKRAAARAAREEKLNQAALACKNKMNNCGAWGTEMQNCKSYKCSKIRSKCNNGVNKKFPCCKYASRLAKLLKSEG